MNKQITSKDHDAYYPILIGQKDYIGNSTFRYYPPAGTINLNRSEIGLESISIPYSWFNVTTAFNNRSIGSIGMPEGASYAFYQVVLDQGFYTVETINSWLQNWSILNNLYLVSDDGAYIYFYEILQNDSMYKIQLNLYEVPTAAEAAAKGWSNPLFNFPTVSGRRPIFTIGSDSNFGKLIGFSPDSYNSVSQLGDLVPQMSPVTNIIVQTINLDNKYSSVPANLHAFTIVNTSFGSMIQVEPPSITYVDVTDCLINYIDIRLVDQNYNNLAFQDTSVLIKIIIKIREYK